MSNNLREYRTGFYKLDSSIKENVIYDGHICLFCKPPKGFKFNGSKILTREMYNILEGTINNAKSKFTIEAKLLFYAHCDRLNMYSKGISSKPMVYFNSAFVVENYVVFEDAEKKRYAFDQTYMNMITNRFKNVKYYIIDNVLFAVGILNKIEANLMFIGNINEDILYMDKYFEKIEQDMK